MADKRIVNPASRLNMLTQPNNPLSRINTMQRALSQANGRLRRIFVPPLNPSSPPVPSGIAVAFQPNNVVRVSWNASNDQNISHYNVYRATDSSGTGATLVGQVSQAPLQTLYFDWADDAQTTQYYFAVQSLDVNSLPSGYSTWVTADDTYRFWVSSSDPSLNTTPLKINKNGVVTFEATLFPGTAFIKWVDRSGNNVATILGEENTAVNGTPGLFFATFGTTASGSTSYLDFNAANSTGTSYGEFYINSAGVFNIDLSHGTNIADSSQALALSVKSYSTNTIYTGFYLYANANGTAAAGLGFGQVFNVEDAGGTLRETSKIISKLNDATAGAWIGELVLRVINSSGGVNVFDATPTQITLGVPVKASTPIAARVFNSANLAILNNTVTALTFDSERYDTDTIHSTSASTSRLTATTAGKYIISGNVEWAATAVGNADNYVAIRLNGSTVIASQRHTPSNTKKTTASISTMYDLAATNYVELILWQDSGSTVNCLFTANLSPEFSMARLV